MSLYGVLEMKHTRQRQACHLRALNIHRIPPEIRGGEARSSISGGVLAARALIQKVMEALI
ncbi:hypothetical protein D9M68_800240 [compost metagenome]